ncbi:hypothetical protein AAHE18_05G000400 [Arachis hypogaea]
MRMDNSLWLEKLKRLLKIQSGGFHCQLCGKEVQHFMTSYRIKILVEDGTSCGMFVLLDSAATKLLGRTCSDVFLLLEDEMEKIEHPYCPKFFHQLIGKEIVFKVQAKRINSPGIVVPLKSSMSLVMHVFSGKFSLISASRMLLLIRALAQYLKTSLSVDSLEVITTKLFLVFQ